MSENNAEASSALAIAGEFTIYTANDLKARLLETIASAKAANIDIDLSEVTEIDSAGLQLMVMAKREAADCGKNVRFCNHCAPVLDVIDLCDLTGFFGDPIRSVNPPRIFQ